MKSVLLCILSFAVGRCSWRLESINCKCQAHKEPGRTIHGHAADCPVVSSALS